MNLTRTSPAGSVVSMKEYDESRGGLRGGWVTAGYKVITTMIVALLAICVSSSSAVGQERKWKFIKYEDSLFSYYDPENIVYRDENRTVEVWLKFLPVPGSDSYARIREDLRRLGIEKEYRSLIIRVEIECTKSEVSQRELVCFDKNRGVIESMQMPPGVSEIEVPLDISEYVTRVVCAKQGD